MTRPVRANAPELPRSHPAPPPPSQRWLVLGPDDPPSRRNRKRPAGGFHAAAAQQTRIPVSADAYNAVEIARLLGITPGQARAAMREAKIRPLERTQWQRLRWSKGEVDAWIVKIAEEI